MKLPYKVSRSIIASFHLRPGESRDPFISARVVAEVGPGFRRDANYAFGTFSSEWCYAGFVFISAARRQIATVSPCWFSPTCSNSTIPASERDLLRRTDTTVVFARIVSP